MITTIKGLPEGMLGVVLSEQVCREDYDTVLIPELEHVISEYDRAKLLICFDASFRGYSLGAAWEDTLVGLRHWQGFERIAVVSPLPWLNSAVAAFAPLLPCPTQCFDAEVPARLWLSESLGAIHLELEQGVIEVKLLGQLEPSAYEGLDDELANLFSQVSPVRLLLDLRAFEGWTGLAALAHHLTLFRDHRHIPERVAVIGHAGWQKLVQRLGSRFLKAQTCFFDDRHLEQAKIWVRQS